ncbi:MAG: restriction endonuclease subunit S [Pseudomonas sp.]
MSSEWREYRIEDIAEVKSGKRLPQGHVLTEAKTPHPYIRLVDVSNGKINKADLKFLTEEARDAIRRYVVSSHDVCLAIVGHTIGMVFYVDPEWHGVNMTENAARLTNFNDSVNSRYLYYYLTSLQGQTEIISRKVGSAQGKLPLYSIKSLRFSAPPRIKQDYIVQLLDSLSLRIDLLRETNATLEAIAQALFKSWFVDFDPVRAKAAGAAQGGADVAGAGCAGAPRQPETLDAATAALFPDSFEDSELGLVPSGWLVKPIGDAVECLGGGTPDTKEPCYWEPAEHAWTTPKDLSGLQSPVLLQTERKLSTLGLAKVSSGLLPAGTLLLSSRAPIGYLAIAQMPVAVNQGYIAIPPSGELSPLFMLFWCRQNMEGIKGRANGSTFMEISKKAFRPIPALVPSTDVLGAFANIADPLFERLIENEQQAQTLTQLRDTLLPRLISGQLRLPEAQAEVDHVPLETA